MPSFNTYGIEMLINVVQNEVFLSEAEAHQCMWASKANWKGGPGKNIEIDLLQENRNKDGKKSIKAEGILVEPVYKLNINNRICLMIEIKWT